MKHDFFISFSTSGMLSSILFFFFHEKRTAEINDRDEEKNVKQTRNATVRETQRTPGWRGRHSVDRRPVFIRCRCWCWCWSGRSLPHPHDRSAPPHLNVDGIIRGVATEAVNCGRIIRRPAAWGLDGSIRRASVPTNQTPARLHVWLTVGVLSTRMPTRSIGGWGSAQSPYATSDTFRIYERRHSPSPPTFAGFPPSLYFYVSYHEHRLAFPHLSMIDDVVLLRY